jgi:hypothetical protein
MTHRPRFTIELTIRDNYSGESYHHAVGCDEALRISSRAVEDLKAGASVGMALVPMEAAVTMMKTREMRRDILLRTAAMLAGQMADRMQDAEGWHDARRVEPARNALGGSRW